MLIVVAFFLAAGLNPSVEFLERRGCGARSRCSIVIVAVLVAVALFLVAIVPVITDQVALAHRQRARTGSTSCSATSRSRSLDDEYQIIDKVQDYVTDGDFVSTLFGGALGFGLAVLGALFNALHRPRADALLPLLARDHQDRALPARPGLAPRPGQPSSATGSSAASAATSPARSSSRCAPASRR